MRKEDAPGEVTALLRSEDLAGRDLADKLLPLVYDELRAIARSHLGRERAGHTLSATALVNEAYLKLVDQTQVTARGRTFFFGAASRAMRQILVDHARRRSRHKRGGGAARVTLDEAQIAVDGFAADLLDLDQALDDLAAVYPRHARVVECRFFGGLTVEETAQVMELSPRTIKSDWALARAWLYRAVNERSDEPGSR